mgnify:CR=1 FL=1
MRREVGAITGGGVGGAHAACETRTSGSVTRWNCSRCFAADTVATPGNATSSGATSGAGPLRGTGPCTIGGSGPTAGGAAAACACSQRTRACTAGLRAAAGSTTTV